MRDVISHCAMRRLVEARSSGRNAVVPRFKADMIAGRALRALFSVSLPVKAAVRVYLLLVRLASLAGPRASAGFLRAAAWLPPLPALGRLVFSWIDLYAAGEEDIHELSC